MPLSSSRSSDGLSLPLTWDWMVDTPSRQFALGFGTGLLGVAPGTWGTLMGWLLWAILLSHFSSFWIFVALVIAFAAGCRIAEQVGNELAAHDHPAIVWDEMVAIWLVLWFAPDTFGGGLVAVILFRLFDIWKPAPIPYFEHKFQNGFGVMWDDIIAALYSIIVLLILGAIGLVS